MIFYVSVDLFLPYVWILEYRRIFWDFIIPLVTAARERESVISRASVVLGVAFSLAIVDLTCLRSITSCARGILCHVMSLKFSTMQRLLEKLTPQF